MPAPGQLRKHAIAKRIILLTLPNHDRAYVRGSQTLNEIGSKLLAKYMPSIDVVIYMHTMHAWLTVQMLWQMHGRTLQAVHMLIVCMGIFLDILKRESTVMWGLHRIVHIGS